MTGQIHSIETMGLVDGPGVRTVVFFQGCRLRCLYCHNPDSWAPNTGKEMTIEEVMRVLNRCRPYYGSNGGLTCSGGEPLLQPQFLTALFKACKQAGISTCLDTAGCGDGDYDAILSYTDLVLLDIKHHLPEDYRQLTGSSPRAAQDFLSAVIRHNTPLWLRHVVVPGLTDSPEHIAGLKAYIADIPNVQRVELLPYHTMGAPKYAQLGLPYRLSQVSPMDKEKLKKLEAQL